MEINVAFKLLLCNNNKKPHKETVRNMILLFYIKNHHVALFPALLCSAGSKPQRKTVAYAIYNFMEIDS